MGRKWEGSGKEVGVRVGSEGSIGVVGQGRIIGTQRGEEALGARYKPSLYLSISSFLPVAFHGLRLGP